MGVLGIDVGGESDMVIKVEYSSLTRDGPVLGLGDNSEALKDFKKYFLMTEVDFSREDCPSYGLERVYRTGYRSGKCFAW